MEPQEAKEREAALLLPLYESAVHADLIPFLFCGDNLTRSNFRKERIYLADNSRLQSLIARQSGQELKQAISQEQTENKNNPTACKHLLCSHTI